MLDRREFLRALGALGVLAAAPSRAQVNPKPRFAAAPFSLGVASGYPRPLGLTLWTRLAPIPDAPGGGMAPEIVPVRWEIARDEAMKDIAESGTVYASPDWAHSVHVDVTGLQAGRTYWYRFSAGNALGPIGRARTAPAVSANVPRLRFALASCQHYEQGYFNAYRHIAADQPDLVLHVGDYIYESSWGRDHVRKHGTPEPITLDVAECPELADPKRTMLGAAQESWLEASLTYSRARWNVIVQQTQMAQFDQKPGPGRAAWTDGWDGYPVARKRLLDFLNEKQIKNPVVLGGDVHSFNINDLKSDFDNPASTTVASEFVGTSIPPQSWSQDRLNTMLPDNPHMKFSDNRFRGYLRVELSPDRWRADLRAMESVRTPEAACSTLKSFVVEDGKPGPMPVSGSS